MANQPRASVPVQPKILIIEDEPAIADTLLYALSTEGFEPHWCATGQAGLTALQAQAFALVVLDVGLPDGSGFEFCKTIRARSSIPVFFLTARSTEIDRIVGLEIGADDYLVKPFSPRELTARVRAILRRSQGGGNGAVLDSSSAAEKTPAPAPSHLATGRSLFSVDEVRCRIRFRDQLLDLTRYEYRLLKTLVAEPGRVFTRDQLMARAWEEPGASLDRTVDAHIKSLRGKLRAIAPDADPIQTHRGLGYSLKE